MRHASLILAAALTSIACSQDPCVGELSNAVQFADIDLSSSTCNPDDVLCLGYTRANGCIINDTLCDRTVGASDLDALDDALELTVSCLDDDRSIKDPCVDEIVDGIVDGILGSCDTFVGPRHQVCAAVISTRSCLLSEDNCGRTSAVVDPWKGLLETILECVPEPPAAY